MQIRDRIKEFRRVPSGELMANPLNHRVHPDKQRKELRKVLKDIGFAGALLAREQDGKLVLIDGHLRAEECKDAELPVLVLDVTEEEGNKILASFDAIGSMAKIDQKILDDLVSTFSDDVFEDKEVQNTTNPSDDIFAEEERKDEEAKKRLKEELDALKNGEKPFGVKMGDWWRCVPSRFLYCGNFYDKSFRDAIDDKEKSQSIKYSTAFVNCPKAGDEDGAMAFEHFLDIAEECWTLTNNDPRILSKLLGHKSCRGVFTFACDGICQIAVYHSDMRYDSFVGPVNFIEFSGKKYYTHKKKTVIDPIIMPPAIGGALIIPRITSYLIGSFKWKVKKDGKTAPRFIIPSVNTGAMLRACVAGQSCRAFMAEPEPAIIERLLAHVFKFPGGDRCGWKNRPPERVDKWIIQQ